MPFGATDSRRSAAQRRIATPAVALWTIGGPTKLRLTIDLAAVLVVTLALGGFVPAASGSTPSHLTHDHLYALPSDGWKPGDGAFLVGGFGSFFATLTPSGACAGWRSIPAGRGSIDAVWPAGYRVRFHPTELLDALGAVVARQGERIDVGGSFASPQDPAYGKYTRDRCADAFVVQSGVTHLKGFPGS